jgi:hypothetical protein
MGNCGSATGAVQRVMWILMLLVSTQACTSLLAPPADVATVDAAYSWVALSGKMLKNVYRGLTKPVTLPEEFQCMDRIDVSRSEVADYVVHFDAMCLSRIATESFFEFRVTPPHRGLKLERGRLIVVERGPGVQVLVQRLPDEEASTDKAEAKAQAGAKTFLRLGEIENERRARMRELIALGLYHGPER